MHNFDNFTPPFITTQEDSGDDILLSCTSLMIFQLIHKQKKKITSATLELQIDPDLQFYCRILS